MGMKKIDAGLWARGITVENPGQITPEMESAVQRFLAPLVRWCHRPSLRGVENLPQDGPFLLVANHSAGTGAAEIFSFIVLYLREVGAQRKLAGFALPLAFRVWPVSRFFREMGAIPSTYEAAADAIGKGVPLLIFPGGDHETLRPIHQAHRVDFGGRVGFLRLAREHGLRIVPMGIAGSHFTAPVLLRSKLLSWLLVLPRLIGQKRWGITLLGVVVAAVLFMQVPWSLEARLALIWLWLGSPLVMLPWIPWTIRMRIGEPLPPAALFGQNAAADDAGLTAALAQVEAAVQAQLDRARHDGAASCQ